MLCLKPVSFAFTITAAGLVEKPSHTEFAMFEVLTVLSLVLVAAVDAYYYNKRCLCL
jgi:hypothetical protein